MTSRAAALAFAAPLLLTAPALADNDKSRRSGASISVDLGSGVLSYNTASNNLAFSNYSRGNRNYGSQNRSYRTNQWGQTSWQVQQLERDATRLCYSAIRSEAQRKGYRDIDFDDGKRVTQTGRQNFQIRFNEVEFETRRRDYERSVTCSVRRGHVASLSGIPQSSNRGYSNNDRDNRRR